MKKSSNKIRNIIIGVSILLAIGFVTFFGVINSVAGVSNKLEYQNKWSFNDFDKGVGISEAILKLPEDTSLFAFTVDYSGEIESIRDKGTCKIDVKYEIFNYNLNSFETIHDKSWSMKEYDTRASELRFDGESVYYLGIPERIGDLMTKADDSSSRRRYDYYWSCLDGMSVSKMLGLIEHSRETDSRYTFKCLYPDQFISEHEDDDEDWEHNDLIYLPRLNSYGSDYIRNNSAKLRITVNKKSNCQSIDENDFDIDLWNVKTPTIDTYHIDGLTCSYQAKYPYQSVSSDYFTKEDCLYQNNLIDCYEDSHCVEQENMEASCEENICEYYKETIFSRIFPNIDPITTPEENFDNDFNYANLLFLLIPFAFLLVFFIILKKKSKRGRK